jgi:hypothetical protein
MPLPPDAGVNVNRDAGTDAAVLVLAKRPTEPQDKDIYNTGLGVLVPGGALGVGMVLARVLRLKEPLVVLAATIVAGVVTMVIGQYGLSRLLADAPPLAKVVFWAGPVMLMSVILAAWIWLQRSLSGLEGAQRALRNELGELARKASNALPPLTPKKPDEAGIMHWVKFERVEIWQAVALSLGYDPASVTNFGEGDKEMDDRFELARSHMGKGLQVVGIDDANPRRNM